MLGSKPWDQWIDEYSRSHQHPVNRGCHFIGIPVIVISLLIALIGVFAPTVRALALALFIAGWIFQFIGHAFERKLPEFFHDWRFLFVGLGWWLVKAGFRRRSSVSHE
jgi:uncharacterized membrane protein YGL010W